ncbi:MAG: hypothetical protein V1754_00590, partial [Pseudomonadota bacterium]
PDFVVSEVIDHELNNEKNLLRQIEGEMLVPSFLENEEINARLKMDSLGKPVYRGLQKFYFQVSIPRCAETATDPLPVLVFGHGLFRSPRQELLTDYHKMLHNRLCMVEVSTHWIGLSEPDVLPITQYVMADFSNFCQITDRLQQSLVNMHTLVQLMKGSFLQNEAMKINGKPVTDGKSMYYLGISNGGNMGVAFAALTNDIERFVFNVSGGWWSQMMERSSNFIVYAELLKTFYKDPLDRALMIMMSQHLWDYTDPIVFAPNVLQSPLSGRKKKKLLFQESKHDDQVPNVATRTIVRALGLTALLPVVESVYGVEEEEEGPLESAYAQWDTKPPIQPPGDNTPAPKPSDDVSAHKVLRTLESCIQQIEQFLTPTGKIVNTCGGVCGKE